jgi:hypothetical protein
LGCEGSRIRRWLAATMTGRAKGGGQNAICWFRVESIALQMCYSSASVSQRDGKVSHVVVVAEQWASRSAFEHPAIGKLDL